MEVYNLSDYLRVIENKPLVLNLHEGTVGALFRGHANVKFELIPSLYRADGLDYYEREMVREFKNNCDHLVKKRPKHEVDWMFYMQHHGMPTRLLDWSESALIALFFAVENTDMHNEDGCVWILDPWALNYDWGEKALRLPSSGSDYVQDHTINPNDPDVPRSPKSKLPIAVRTQRNSIRAVNQKAMVTVHGYSKEPINEIECSNGSEVTAKINIPASYKPKILDELFRIGVSHQLIYPSPDSLSKDIFYKYSKLSQPKAAS